MTSVVSQVAQVGSDYLYIFGTASDHKTAGSDQPANSSNRCIQFMRDGQKADSIYANIFASCLNAQGQPEWTSISQVSGDAIFVHPIATGSTTLLLQARGVQAAAPKSLTQYSVDHQNNLIRSVNLKLRKISLDTQPGDPYESVTSITIR